MPGGKRMLFLHFLSRWRASDIPLPSGNDASIISFLPRILGLRIAVSSRSRWSWGPGSARFYLPSRTPNTLEAGELGANSGTIGEYLTFKTLWVGHFHCSQKNKPLQFSLCHNSDCKHLKGGVTYLKHFKTSLVKMLGGTCMIILIQLTSIQTGSLLAGNAVQDSGSGALAESVFFSLPHRKKKELLHPVHRWQRVALQLAAQLATGDTRGQ